VQSVPGWPTGNIPVPRPAGGGPSPSMARLCAAPVRSAGRPVHLLAAMDHTSRAVLTQRQVGGAPDAAEFLVARKHAHYLFTVKANQPTLLTRCAAMPWHNVPVGDRTRDRAHGRVEPRTLKVVSVNGFGFPHAAQVLHVTRKTRQLHANRWRAVTVYAITSLPFQLAHPTRLADLLRGHWAIEALHHVRDTTSPRTTPRSAPAPPPTPWRSCAIWRSGCSVGRSRSTSPPRCAATPATHADPSPASGSASDETDITTERPSPGPPPDCAAWTSTRSAAGPRGTGGQSWPSWRPPSWPSPQPPSVIGIPSTRRDRSELQRDPASVHRPGGTTGQ
jgi:hypothetical protein